MGFYLRDSIRIGPIRINFSRHGIGLSIGLPGLRIGTGPKGPYLHAGMDGIYYRRSLADHRAQPDQDRFENMTALSPPTAATLPGGRETGLAAVLNTARARPRLRGPLIGACLASAIIAGLLIHPACLLLLSVVPLAWKHVGKIDARRRRVTWTYGIPSPHYAQVMETFAALAACRGQWQIMAGKGLSNPHQRKRHAGALHLLHRRRINAEPVPPDMLVCDVMPPAFLTPGLNLYLLPDILLMEDRTGFAALSYDTLDMRWETTSFVENGSVPQDSEVTGRTWQHPNQDGGPDRRFRANRELPVCRYATLRIGSDQSPLQILLLFSRPDPVGPFVAAVRHMSDAGDTTALFDRMLRSATTQASVQQPRMKG